ncbi:hypothetical protein ACWGNU_08955 [Paenibacillus lautus]
MVGIVKFINPSENVIALQTALNEYSIIEVSDLNMLELGDVLLGEIRTLGSGTIFNITKSCMINLIIREISVDHRNMQRSLTQ